MEKPWRIEVLGTLKITHQGVVVSKGLTRPRCRLLLGHLANADYKLHPATAATVDENISQRKNISKDLWGSDSSCALDSLNHDVLFLDKDLLGTFRRDLYGGPQDLLIGRRQNYLALNYDAVTCDLSEFRYGLEAADRMTQQSIARIVSYTLALSQYGSFLPGANEQEQDAKKESISLTNDGAVWLNKTRNEIDGEFARGRRELVRLLDHVRLVENLSNDKLVVAAQEVLCRRVEPGTERAIRWLNELLSTPRDGDSDVSHEGAIRVEPTELSIRQATKPATSLIMTETPLHPGSPEPLRGYNYDAAYGAQTEPGFLLTPLFGRTEELPALVGLLREQADSASTVHSPHDRHRRLISLVGLPGSGKTRLAYEAANQVRVAFSGHVRCVPLAYVRSVDSAESAMLRSLRIQPAGTASFDQLVSAIKDDPWLFVLDSFEYLIDRGGAGWIAQLLDQCPHLIILITSQHRLGSSFEHVIGVLPLAPPAKSCSMEEINKNACVLMFVDRAQSRQPSFQPSEADLRTIAELCRKLEGLPLVIELAARRIESRAPQQMLEGVSQRMIWLEASGSDIEPRHKSLRSTLDWSFNLFDEPRIQHFFVCVSVLHGHWLAEDASAISGFDVETSRTFLELLIGCRFVDVDMSSNQRSYHMLDTLRLYGQSLLSELDASIVMAKHAEHYLQAALTAGDLLNGATKVDALVFLDRQVDNYSTALDWLANQGRKEDGLKMCSAIHQFWHIRGYWKQAHYWSDRLLQMPGELTPLFEAVVLNNLAGIYRNRGYGVQALRLYRKARLIHSQDQDQWRLSGVFINTAIAHINGGRYRMAKFYGALASTYLEALVQGDKPKVQSRLAVALLNQGLAENNCGELAEALSHMMEAHSLFRLLEDDHLCAASMSDIAFIHYKQGRYAEAAGMFEASQEIRIRVGDARGIADVVAHQGIFKYLHGELAQARELLLQALARYEVLGDPWCITCMCEKLCQVALNEHNIDLAQHYGQRAFDIRSAMGNAHLVAVSIADLGDIARYRGEPIQAADYYRDALTGLRKAHALCEFAECLERYGSLQSAKHQWLSSCYLLAAADEIRSRTGCVIAPIHRQRCEQDRQAVQQTLGSEAVQAHRDIVKTCSTRSMLDLIPNDKQNE